MENALRMIHFDEVVTLRMNDLIQPTRRVMRTQIVKFKPNSSSANVWELISKRYVTNYKASNSIVGKLTRINHSTCVMVSKEC